MYRQSSQSSYLPVSFRRLHHSVELSELTSFSRALGAHICWSFQSSSPLVTAELSELIYQFEHLKFISISDLSKLVSIGELSEAHAVGAVKAQIYR